MPDQCAYCNKPLPDSKRGRKYCDDKCKARYHREKKAPGTVRGISACSDGWVVVVHFRDAPKFKIGQRVGIASGPVQAAQE